MRIGGRFANSAIEKELATGVVDDKTLDAAVALYPSDYAALCAALKQPFKIPIHYDMNADINTTALVYFRDAGRSLSAKGQAELRAGHIDDSLTYRLAILQLAQPMTRSGLLVHFLVGIAIEGVGAYDVYQILPKLNLVQCKLALRALKEHDRGRESMENVRRREVVWMVITNGWPNHVGYLLEVVAHRGNIELMGGSIDQRNDAAVRLLLTQYAIRAYQLERGRLPDRLAELVPDYLSEMPIDPYAAEGTPLGYKRTGTAFNLWSIGPDCNDDGGMSLPKEDAYGIQDDSKGDLRLEDLFAPDR
jgi:hypothetical protein